MTEPTRDQATNLARFLVLDAARRSAALLQHFAEQAASFPDAAEQPMPRAAGSWPTLTAEEIRAGFGMAERVVRGAGFDNEADRLATLGETHGNG